MASVRLTAMKRPAGAAGEASDPIDTRAPSPTAIDPTTSGAPADNVDKKSRASTEAKDDDVIRFKPFGLVNGAVFKAQLRKVACEGLKVARFQMPIAS